MDLFISDIHGNITNLELLDLEKYKTIFFLGDLYGSFEGDEDIKRFFQKYGYKIICVKGNCDYEFDYNDLGVVCNESINFTEDNINIYCTHGNRIKPTNADVVIYGHEHIPYIKREEKVYICVGSVSKPRNSLGASYLEYEDKEFILKDFNNNVIDQIKISS